MHEGTHEERDRESNRERKLARLRALAAARDDALLAALPPVGTVVEGLVLEALLGQGGYGSVYLARRDGQTVAVKFIYLPQAAGWALRELGAMVRLETVGGVGLRGHGLWPPDKPVFQFIVMEYVEGWELYTWARHHNPHALEVVGVLLDMAQELTAVHSVDVIHRDLKGDNVLVREEDGRALLVDFGVATWPGAPRITGPQVPGCHEYLSPEVVRYHRGERERHEASGLDDLWALGVVAYQLLTGTYPFQGHNAAETERAILHEAPQPPHVRNPRVPLALSQVCLRLLEKEPGARYPDARALHAALQEVKRGADEQWKVPLCEAWGPDAAPTPQDVALVTRERMARLERLLEYERRPPGAVSPGPRNRCPRPLPPRPRALRPVSHAWTRRTRACRGCCSWRASASCCWSRCGWGCPPLPSSVRTCRACHPWGHPGWTHRKSCFPLNGSRLARKWRSPGGRSKVARARRPPGLPLPRSSLARRPPRTCA